VDFDCLLQFLPGNAELSPGALMIRSIQPHVLQKDVEAMDEWARRYSGACFACARARNRKLPKIAVVLSVF
jgi:hypothetical protein